ncbi:hypothetical protein AOL_s00007g460 [Orbilia oligospora ATCC 24927]|uniref:Autophagy-related protein 27 n=2 Tax=Orbilia oligospora TaxID=2813651 RepID=G1X2F1_ARTOA|nr:hypothetical protein AOL_s00007g460 [Orbilia oligospora ATCC 24927]EGX52677.1 hypothetical protein AOL_s00007g460 [Orbilia oligospora ATCC 24927]KAF3280883.1 hypothetical protein TWF970_002563 [Orbilia oligospora]
MNYLLLPLLVLPSVLGGCARFSTTERWTIRGRYGNDGGYPAGYKFLEDAPVIQATDFFTCNQQTIIQTRPCAGNISLCGLEPQGLASVTARFSVTPVNNNEDVLRSFFGLVSGAVEANGRDESYPNRKPPRYQACGEVGGSGRTYCLAVGDQGWIRYSARYLCVNGTAEECTDGPFESGTKLVVCGVDGEFPNGDLSFESNRTAETAPNYMASDMNPALNSSLTCGASMSELKGWSFGFMGLAVIAGFIL